MMYWGEGMGGWGYGLMVLSTVVSWGLLIVAVVLLVRYLGGDRRHPSSTPTGPDPRQVLAERFARGEIDEDEYRRRLRVLDGGRHIGPTTQSRWSLTLPRVEQAGEALAAGLPRQAEPLLEQVDAVPVPFDHAGDAADLPLDLRRPAQVIPLVLGVARSGRVWVSVCVATARVGTEAAAPSRSDGYPGRVGTCGLGSEVSCLYP